MKIKSSCNTGAGLQNLVLAALRETNLKYKNNLKLYRDRFEGAKKQWFAFVLRPKNSHETGARLNHTGTRHVWACSWQAHRDFMLEVFKRDPKAQIKSHMADYRGLEDFKAKFAATGQRNIGSMMQPCSYEGVAV